mgnify:CR=1 FL=1
MVNEVSDSEIGQPGKWVKVDWIEQSVVAAGSWIGW